jgi:Ca2+-binding EF-hand superfamily protein
MKGHIMNQSVKQALFILLMQSVFALYCAGQSNDYKVVFRSADTNQDGKITLDEFKEHAKQAAFTSADRNGDRIIDKQEWQKVQPPVQAEQKFEAIDKDLDKRISFLEFSDSVDRTRNFDEVFNALDRNRDGSLSPDEFNDRPAFTIFSIKF